MKSVFVRLRVVDFCIFDKNWINFREAVVGIFKEQVKGESIMDS